MATISKPVLIYFPLDLLAQMDSAADLLAVSRSELARRCIRRDLGFLLQHEVSSVANFHNKVQAEHRTWVKSNSSHQKQKQEQGMP